MARKEDHRELEKSLFRKIGDPILSSVAVVGNLLDVPASVGRDIIGGATTGDWRKYNPLDQLLTPFSSKNRKYGRDILTDWGLQQRNKETGVMGWVDDPMEAVRDLSGFAFDVGTDPFLGAPKLTSRAVGALGRGALNLTDKATNLIPFARPVKAAAGKGIRKGKLLSERLFDPEVRGVISSDPNILQSARRLTRAQRDVQDEVFESHVPFLSRMEQAGLTGPEHQQMIRDLLEEAQEVKRNDLGEIIFEPRTFTTEPIPGGAGGTRSVPDPLKPLILPKVEPASVPPLIQEYVDFVKGRSSQLLSDIQASGGRAKELEDVVGYAHRQAAESILEKMNKDRSKQAPGSRRALGSTDPRDAARSRIYKGFLGGTGELNELLSDPRWRSILDNAPSHTVAREMIEDAIDMDLANNPNALLQFQDKYGLKGRTDPGTQELIEAVEGIADRRYGATIEREFTAKKKGAEVDPVTGERIEVLRERPVDRYKLLSKKIMDYQKEFQETKGMFVNSPAVDAIEGEIAARNQIAARDNLVDLLADERYHKGQFIPTQGKTQGQRIDHIIDSMNVEKPVFLERIANKIRENRGAPPLPSKSQIDELRGQLDQITDRGAKVRLKRELSQLERERADELKAIRNTILDDEAAEAIVSLNPSFKMPEEVGELGRFWRNYSQHFKAGVLSWPARYVRDVTSALVRLWENKRLDMGSVKQASDLVQGRTVRGLSEVPAVQQWLRRTGREINDENASLAAREMFGAYRGHSVYSNLDLPDPLPGTGKVEDYLDLIPGRKGRLNVRGVTKGASGNPTELAGTFPVIGKRSKRPRQETKFLPYRFAERVGRFTDEWGRMAGFLNALKKGEDASQAMREVNRLLVDYRPQNFTKFDRALKNIFPFWSFMKAQVPYVFRELTQKPGGRLAQTIRAQNMATGDPEQFLPDYLSETATIPLGEQPDGSQRFVGGLGLMHEDPLQFLGVLGGAGIESTLSEIGSRLHPGIKGPAELAFGRSLFRRDMLLDELDPSLGRILTNAGVLEPEPSGRAKPFPSQLGEHILANSPLSRALTSIRTLGDTRKGLPGKAVNLLTGARITDVPQYQREGILRDLAGEIVEDLSPRKFERTYFRKGDIEEMAEVDPQAAQQMEAFNELMNLLGDLAKERARSQKENRQP